MSNFLSICQDLVLFLFGAQTLINTFSKKCLIEHSDCKVLQLQMLYSCKGSAGCLDSEGHGSDESNSES